MRIAAAFVKSGTNLSNPGGLVKGYDLGGHLITPEKERVVKRT